MTYQKHKELLDEFTQRIEAQRFYDAHESLEVIWFPRRFEDDDEVKLLKGFINAAVSFELLKRGRVDSSKKVWKNYLKYKMLLCKVSSPHIKQYHKISKYLESYKNRLYLYKNS